MKDKKTKPKKEVLEIEGLMNNEDIRWKKIPCKCAQDPNDVTHRYPIANCLHCKFQECEDSIPRECFTVTDPVIKDGKPTDKFHTRTITKIKIHRGKIYDDVLGFYAV